MLAGHHLRPSPAVVTYFRERDNWPTTCVVWNRSTPCWRTARSNYRTASTELPQVPGGLCPAESAGNRTIGDRPGELRMIVLVLVGVGGSERAERVLHI